MHRDAHFYAILAFCRACGFNKLSAYKIAYASQHVDDAKINLIFYGKTKEPVEHDLVANRPAFFNMATCHSYFLIKTFNYEAMVKNTCAFHFVPGCKGTNFTKKLRCMEETPVIMDILNEALNEDDLIKLGIVLHVYADTYSHQGFSGLLSKVNDIKNCKPRTKVYIGFGERILNVLKQFSQENYDRLFDRVVPAYGHVQATEFPDLPYLQWSYEYDYSSEFDGSYKLLEIDNRERYQRAFNNIRKYLESYLAKHSQYLDHDVDFNRFDLLLEALVLPGTKKARELNWRKTLITLGLFNKGDKELLVYKDDKWLREAFVNFDRKVFNSRKVEGAELAEHFQSSNWYRFYLAVKWYKRKFFEYCAKHQLNIPN